MPDRSGFDMGSKATLVLIVAILLVLNLISSTELEFSCSLNEVQRRGQSSLRLRRPARDLIDAVRPALLGRLKTAQQRGAGASGQRSGQRADHRAHHLVATARDHHQLAAAQRRE